MDHGHSRPTDALDATGSAKNARRRGSADFGAFDDDILFRDVLMETRAAGLDGLDLVDHLVDGISVERWVTADWQEDRGECIYWDGERLERTILS